MCTMMNGLTRSLFLGSAWTMHLLIMKSLFNDWNVFISGWFKCRTSEYHPPLTFSTHCPIYYQIKSLRWIFFLSREIAAWRLFDVNTCISFLVEGDCLWSHVTVRHTHELRRRRREEETGDHFPLCLPPLLPKQDFLSVDSDRCVCGKYAKTPRRH